MTRILIYDTETTGLPNKKEKDLSKQPYIIQFAGIIGEISDDGKWVKEKEINQLIKPPISIPYFTSKIHNIYDIDVKNSPPMIEVIEGIVDDINGVDIVVGHNVEFDNNMIKIEIERAKLLGKPVDFIPNKIICTMYSSIGYCKLPSKNKNSKKFKRPKLSELYRKLFGKYFTGSHDAIIDVKATGRSFVKLVKEGVINLNKKEIKNLRLF